MARFNPDRGGHAPGHLREWFTQLVTDEVDEEGPPRLSLFRLCGLLWNCTDCMPSDLRQEVRDRWLEPFADPGDDPYSYAQAARLIRAVLSEEAMEQ
jgi:hypothetical protein